MLICVEVRCGYPSR